MNKKNWISAEIIDLGIKNTEASANETPNHDLTIIGYTVEGDPLHGHS